MLSPSDPDSRTLGWSEDFDSLDKAQALFDEYLNLECYGGESFDLFLQENDITIKDNFT